MQWRVAKKGKNISGFEIWTFFLSIFEIRKKLLEKKMKFPRIFILKTT
jgi:hypothetical protein